MNAESLFRRAKKANLNSPQEEASLEKIRRQRILSGELSKHFTPKGYPTIFLDQRLRSVFFK